MREGIRAGADLPSNLRATFIGGKQRLPDPAELLPGLAVDDVRAVEGNALVTTTLDGLGRSTIKMSGPSQELRGSADQLSIIYRWRHRQPQLWHMRCLCRPALDCL